jgi:hypothetical protein
MGAAHVFEIEAETPPIRKSVKKPVKPFSLGAGTNTGTMVVGTKLWPPIRSMGQRVLLNLQALGMA